jgi:hypothetical protein
MKVPSPSLFAALCILLSLASIGNAFIQPGGAPRLLVGSSRTILPVVGRPMSHTGRLTTKAPKTAISTTTDGTNNESSSSSSSPSFWARVAETFSQTAAEKTSRPYRKIESEKERSKVALNTLLRVGIPSVVAGVVSTFAFPGLALGLCTLFNDAGVFSVLSQDASQFVQNFLTVAGLLFSILVGQTFYFLYQQQEMVYYALFNEVTEAKSLLEQVALVCQGRSMYTRCLDSISRYVRDDLKNLRADPAKLLSARPVDDPLESIMYMTSVGVPSTVYETVRSLRQARAARLGALQRKLPPIHMLLLWILAVILLSSFPLLGAGTQSIGGYNILTVEGVLFGVMTSGIVLTLRVVGELWRPAGGAYNVDSVLSIMVSGLEEELKARMNGTKIYSSSSIRSSNLAPSGSSNSTFGTNERAIMSTSMNESSSTGTTAPARQQGADALAAARRVARWVRR